MTTAIVLLIAAVLVAVAAPRYGADTRWSTGGRPARRTTPARDLGALAAAVCPVVAGAVRAGRHHAGRQADGDPAIWTGHRA